MNIFLWILQGLLALVFMMSGILKLSQPKEKLGERMNWVKTVPPRSVKLIGLVELLGALGLILPAVTGIWPWLTPLAAAGLVVVMAGAAFTHYRLKEYPAIGMPAVLLILAAVAAVGRFWISPL